MPSRLTPEQRTMRARCAAHAMHAQGKTNTKPATDASAARFEREVDPDGVLPPDERARRVEHARKAYMVGLAFRASKAAAAARTAKAEQRRRDRDRGDAA